MPIKVRQGGAWVDVSVNSGPTYTLPLTGANGATGVGSAKWTLDASTGTDTSVTLNPGTNINISSINVSGNDRSFTLDATNSKYDYVLVDHGSSTGSGTGNDSILRLDGDTASGNTDDDIRLIAGTNVIFTPNTSANTLTIAATPGGVTTFLGLTDTPLNYSGQAGKIVKVNSTPNGLEFSDETSYLLKCTKDSDGGSTGSDSDPYLFLDASSGTDDSVRMVGAGGLTITRNNDGQLTIDGSGSGTTYDLGTRSTPSIRLTGSDASTDDITFSGTGNITVTSDGNSQSGGTITIDGSSITGTTYDYLLVDHGSSTGAGSGNDSVLRLDPSTGTNDDIRLIAGSNVTLTPNTGTNTLTIAAAGATGPTYTLPLTGSTGSSGNATWTLDSSTGTDNSVKLNAGTNVSISSLDTTGPAYEFTIDVAAAGGLSLDATLTDVLDLTGSALSADSAGADKMVFWDESAGKLTHLNIGTNLSITGTTLNAAADNDTTYDLLGGGSDGGSFGSGTGKIILRPNSGSDDEVTITAGTNIKIDNTGTSGFTITADDVASTAFKYKNSGTGTGNAIFELYPSGGSGAADQKVTVTPGTGINFSNTTQGLTITATGGGSSDEYVDGVSWNTGNGILTLTRNVGGDLTVDLDGRYAEGNTKYDLEVPAGTTKIRLAGDTASGNTNDDIELVGGTNVDITRDSSSQLTIAFDSAGFALDKIVEGDTLAEVVDSGSNGYFKVEIDGTERFRVKNDGETLLKRTNTNLEGGHLQFEDSGGTESFAIDVYKSNSPTSGDSVLRFLNQATAANILSIDKVGAIAPGGVNYGTNGQVLTSKGAGVEPIWGDGGGPGSAVCYGYLTGTSGGGAGTIAGTSYNIANHSGGFGSNDGFNDNYDGGIQVNLTTGTGSSNYPVVVSGYSTMSGSDHNSTYPNGLVQMTTLHAYDINSTYFKLQGRIQVYYSGDGTSTATRYPDRISFAGFKN